MTRTLDWMAGHGAVWVGADAPSGDPVTIMSPVDGGDTSGPRLPAARGRNLEGYVRGRSVAERFAWRYSDTVLEEIAGRELLGQTAVSGR